MNSTIKLYWNSQPSRRGPNVKKPNLQTVIQNHIQHAGISFKGQRPQLHWIAKISIICYFVTNLTQLIALIMAKDDPKKLFTCLSTLAFCAVGFIKLWSLLVYYKLWSSLIAQSLSLEDHQIFNLQSKHEYESDNDENNDFSDHVTAYTNKFNYISNHLSRIYYFSVFIFIISSFIEYGLHLNGRILASKYPHILPGLAPLDINIFGYLATIIAEAIAAVYCVTVHKVFDLTVIGLMIFIRGQFSLVHKFSERIGGKGNNNVVSKKRDNRAHYRIKNCHHIHVSLVKMVTELCGLIQNILGIYFFLATLTLCTVAVQLQWEDLSVTQILSLLQYMSAILTQLYFFCHYGDAVYNQSSVNQGEGPFSAAVWCLGAKVRREIAILGVGMSKPCRIFAGPFNTLNLPSFIQIVRAAYSTYAVLNHTSK